MSGFMNHDYILVYEIADPARARALGEVCDGEWQGDRVLGSTWEISNELSPREMETRILSFLSPGDRAAYYYLADAKRIFRVDLE
jgi:hypothetical protein